MRERMSAEVAPNPAKRRLAAATLEQRLCSAKKPRQKLAKEIKSQARPQKCNEQITAFSL